MPAAAMLGLVAVCTADSVMAGSVDIVSGPGRAGELSWERLEIGYFPSRPQGRWRLLAEGLSMPPVGELGSLELECVHGRLASRGLECEQGMAIWEHEVLDASVEIAFSMQAGADQTIVNLSGEAIEADLHWLFGVTGEGFRFDIERADLSKWPGGLVRAAGLREVDGLLEGRVVGDEAGVQLGFRIRDGSLDSIDGMVAAAGLDMSLNAEADWLGDETAFSFEIIQHDGEILAGSVYLSPPAGELAFSAAGLYHADGSIGIDRFSLDDPDALRLNGRLVASGGDEGWQLDSLAIDELEFDLPRGWQRWLDGPLSGYGLGGLETAGNIRGEIEWSGDEIELLSAKVRDLDIADPAGRFHLDAVVADVGIRKDRLDADLAWEGVRFYGLPFGASSVRVTGDGQRIGTDGPLRFPLLDGAVVIDRMAWQYDDRELMMDARIEPVDLAALTRLLEFPEFGGVLSGRFPGVVYADEQLRFTGGIDIEAFSGRIRLSDLAVERPFGTLPALATQVEIERLDLAEVTGAFNIGHMEGWLSGWMRDLRLLDWRPVAMDARLYTHEDAPRRRISQRAVENLSSLGGSPGGALVSGTVMRVFSEFPYRRVALACRLSNNICHMDGVRPHESGGFYIIEGRALPRLDIIGHRRLVDWPHLLAQLAAMVEGD